MKYITKQIKSRNITIGGDGKLLLIAGPCVIENWDILCRIAESLLNQCRNLPFTLVFKASYDKANRSSNDSYRGPGIEKGLELLSRLRERFNIPILSDVHTPEEARQAREILDIIQIPALLCRQNNLLKEAGANGRIVNIKKGQFMAPQEMQSRIQSATGPDGISRAIITERGTFFGYNNLVNDFKGVVFLRKRGLPVIFDATHSVQLPGSMGNKSGGEREYVPALAKAACAVGVDGFFFEIHPDPDKALCDGLNSLPMNNLGELLKTLSEIDALIRE